MKVINAGINWKHGLGNEPALVIQVDKIYESSDFVYEQKGQLFFAEREGQCSFFHWEGPEDNGGYYGEFPIFMKNGTIVRLLGPWSSRSGVMNQVFTTQCLEVSLTTVPFTVDENGDVDEVGTYFSGAITTNLAGQILRRLNAHLVQSRRGMDIVYTIVDNESGKKRMRDAIRKNNVVTLYPSGLGGLKVEYRNRKGDRLESPTTTFTEGQDKDHIVKYLKRWEEEHDLRVVFSIYEA